MFSLIKKAFALTIIVLTGISGFSQATTRIKNIDQHMGNTVTICGTILSIRNLENVKNKPILINLGGNDVSEHLDVVLGTGDSSLFSFQPDSLLSKAACITGVPFYFKGGGDFLYLKAENIRIGEKEITASPLFQQQTIQDLKVSGLDQASHNRSLKRVVILKKGLPELQKKRQLVTYLKAGHLLSYRETRQKKIYTVLLKTSMDE